MNEQLQSDGPTVTAVSSFEPVIVEPMPAAPAEVVKRGRPGWLVPVAIASIGVIVSGVLGGLLYVNTSQRDLARKQLAATSATLATTRTNLADTSSQLGAARIDAAAKATTATYAATYVADSGSADTAIQSFFSTCTSSAKFSVCRDGAQQALVALQTFQSDRAGLTVPSQLSASDAMLKDSLSAAIAAMQEIITGGDDNNLSQIDDGSAKLYAAQLGLAKAGASMGASLK
jgi:hypothetical protein